MVTAELSDTSPALPPTVQNWVERAHAGGWAGVCAAALTAFEPLAIFGAQMLYAVVPFAHLTGQAGTAGSGLRELAAWLEMPGGADRLRAALETPISGREETL